MLSASALNTHDETLTVNVNDVPDANVLVVDTTSDVFDLGETPPGKLTFSCARDAGLKKALEDNGRKQIIVTGIEAHVCVLQTALDLLNAGYEVFVPHDAVNSRRKADRKWALRRMASAGAVITTTESALFELLERCDTTDFKTVAKLIKRIPV